MPNDNALPEEKLLCPIQLLLIPVKALRIVSMPVQLPVSIPVLEKTQKVQIGTGLILPPVSIVEFACKFAR